MRHAKLSLLLMLTTFSSAHCRARPPSNTQCTFTSECKEPLVCAAGMCREQCQTDRDCHPDFNCERSSGMHVCVEAKKCVYDSECGDGQMCANDGECHDECAADLDCRSFGSKTHCNLAEGRCEAPMTDAGMDVPRDVSTDTVMDVPLEADTPVPDVFVQDTMDVPLSPVLHVAAGERRLACGSRSCCAVNAANNNVLCWGDNTDSRAGQPFTLPTVQSPTFVSNLGADPMRAIFVGEHACAVQMNAMGCWGPGEPFVLGVQPPPSTLYMPFVASQFSGATLSQITPLSQGSCAITSSNNLYCWGTAATGQLPLGRITTMRIDPPEMLTVGLPAGFQTPVEMSVHGWRHACLIYNTMLAPKRLACWGDNDKGQVNPAGGSSLSMVAITALSTGNVAEVDVGMSHTCVRMEDNTIYCWGSNEFGQLGTGGANATFQDRFNMPVQLPVATGEVPIQLSLGQSHSCALTSQGHVVCWGLNDKQQVAPLATTEMCSGLPCVSMPRLVDLPARFVELSSGR